MPETRVESHETGPVLFDGTPGRKRSGAEGTKRGRRLAYGAAPRFEKEGVPPGPGDAFFHFGWMAVMFGSIHVDTETGKNLTELRRFNLYLGSVEMLVISIIVAGLCILYLIKKHSSEKAVQTE